MGKLYVVGIGPGDKEKLTLEALDILEKCETIIGYTVYVELVKKYLPDKKYLSTGMTKEEDRCRMAFEQCAAGGDTAMICSGDAGVYGLAGLILSMGRNYPDTEVVIVPGVTAALSGAAVLGAPLGHDFAIISLSDLLTPWERIEKRIRLAAGADLAMAIYNPSSKKRSDYLKKACDIIMEEQPESLVCGYVKNIGREGEDSRVLTIKELRDTQVDMFTTVFIGNSMTKNINGKMVTPRGYNIEINK